MNLHINEVNIDLRKELGIMLDDYGHDIVLIRVSRVTCSCASTDGQQVSDKCPKCLGIGRVIKAYRVCVVDETAAQVMTLPNSLKQGLVGDIYSNAKAFYFRHNINPMVGDFVYEVSWIGEKVGTIHGVYAIEHCEPLRMEKGRIEYYLASGHREVSNIQFKEKALKRLTIRRIKNEL